MSSSPISSPRQFSCAKSEASSCPSTPSPNSPTSTTSTSSRAKEEAYYALMAETANLHAEVEALREQLDYYHQHHEEPNQQPQPQPTQQQPHQSPQKWIAENLEEAQHVIDNIVGIKGITEDPLKAAIMLGVSSHTASAAVDEQQKERELLQQLLMSNLTSRREHDFIEMCDDQNSMPFKCGR